MYDGYQSHALKTRLAIPLLYGVDAVHGHNNVLGAVIFPHNIGLGCTRNPALVETAAAITAEEVRATGIQWAFAPCVTVPRDIRWGRTYEGFGEEPELARTLGEAAVRGFQGSDLSDPLSVLACAKHFVGDGGTTWGTGHAKGKPPQHLDSTRATHGSDEADAAPHPHAGLHHARSPPESAPSCPPTAVGTARSARAAGACSPRFSKKKLGFQGFLISDYAAIDQLARRLQGPDRALDQRGHGHGDGSRHGTRCSSRI